MQKVFSAMAALIITGAALFTASPASATAPGENGRIAYRRYFNPEHTWGAIFTIRSNGTGTQRVTHPGRNILHTEPDWSPNGRWITFDRYWHGEKIRADHPRQIVKIHPNGTGRTNLSKVTCQAAACLGDYQSAWSPDGKRIAFIRLLGPLATITGGVFVMRANGTHARRVTDQGDRFEDFAPMWSPGGHRLEFVRFDEQRDKDALFVVRANGTHEQRITPWRVNCAQNPDWSPNGRWILATCHPQEQTDLWLVHPNGTKLHRLTHSAGVNVRWLSSSFSPDGTMIVSSEGPGIGLELTGNPDIFVLNRDGSGLQNITQTPRWDSAPDWGPRRD